MLIDDRMFSSALMTRRNAPTAATSVASRFIPPIVRAEPRGGIKLGAVVKVYSLLDRVDHVAMEERPRVTGLDQHRRVECTVTDAENTRGWRAYPKASVSRILLDRDDQVGWLRRELLDVGVEISVLVGEEKVACASAEMAEKALTCPVGCAVWDSATANEARSPVIEDPLTFPWHFSFQA